MYDISLSMSEVIKNKKFFYGWPIQPIYQFSFAKSEVGINPLIR